jgi:NADPH-dependent 2,4-dienoyl-CoA reductase/sulfur reductase-like enzyme
VATKQRICVVGASLAGLRATETLRAEGYDGIITVIGEEPEPPYNRPPLSKQFLTALGDARTSSAGELALPQRDGLDIDWRLGIRAIGLSIRDRRIDTTDGPVTGLTGVIIATGATPRRLALPGGDALDRVQMLRTIGDATALRDLLERGGPVVVAGAGLIGCEVAAACAKLGVPVTLVDPLAVPMCRVLGADGGALMGQVHEQAGVSLRLGVTIDGVDGRRSLTDLTLLTLSDGGRLPVDTLVVAIGAQAATGWLEGSGLPVADGILCDGYGRVHGMGDWIVAAGDVARWPAPGGTQRGEHWTGAAEQAVIAARTLVRGPSGPPPQLVPFAWSEHGHLLQVVGHPQLADATTLTPCERTGGWSLAYTRGGDLIATAALDTPRAIAVARRQLVAGVPEDEGDLRVTA